MSGWARWISWALSLSQRLAAEGSSIVVRLLPRFLLRLESLEERSDFAEAIRGGWLRLQCPCRDASSLDAVFLSKSGLSGDATSPEADIFIWLLQALRLIRRIPSTFAGSRPPQEECAVLASADRFRKDPQSD